MPRDGSGQFNLPAGNPYVNGTVIDETVVNSTMSDLASGLTGSLAKDGQTTATGNLPMGGNKLTNVGDGTARNQHPSIGQLQDGGLITLGSVSGTDTITGALTPSITSYATRMLVTFTPANNNTGAVTIAINGLAAKSIVKGNAAALVAGDLVTTVPAVLLYDGTNFVLLNPQHNVANDEVTFARMQNVSTDTLIGRSTAGTGDPESIACTAAGRALIDDANAAAQRTTLGLGTAATKDESALSIARSQLTVGTGALVYSHVNLSISNATNTMLTFDSEIFDDANVHSTSSNTSRLTVPSGVNRVVISAGIAQLGSTSTNSSFRMTLYKNGSMYTPQVHSSTYNASTNSATYRQELISPPIPVTAGDYFEIEVWQNIGSTMTLALDTVWASMEFVQ